VTEEVAIFGALAVVYLLVIVAVFAVSHRTLPSKSFLAAVAFLAVYVGALAIAFGAGRLLGGSMRSAAATALLVLLFSASLPFVEFKNACDVGRTLVVGETEC